MTVDTDEMVWRRVLSGDERAFGVIWDRHSRRILRHLVEMGNTATDAEDLSAATFMELWRRRDSVRIVEGSVLPWLIVTARNVARNAARARRRYRNLLASLPPARDTADHAEFFAEQDSEWRVQLRAAIRKCRPLDAGLLAMTALEGFTAAEAGAAYGLSEAAAKMRISRLRARLRSTISTNAVSEGGSR